jgi:hypothetical protein
MRTKLLSAAAVLVLTSAAAEAEKLGSEFRAAFEQKFREGQSYAVVARKGVPTTSIYGVKGDQTNAHYSINIVEGDWRTSQGLLDTDQTAADFLDLGEVMELANISYKDNRIDLRMVSVESKKVTRGGGFLSSTAREPVATNFKFFLPYPKSKVLTSADVPAVVDYIGAYLKVFPDESRAKAAASRIVSGGTAEPPARRSSSGPVKKEIKVGMTSLEVIEILGKPQKEVVFQNATRWTYPDLTVIFENGRVKEVKF